METKERLKQLREERKGHIKRIQLLIKEQNKTISLIKKSLEDGPKTPPEISSITSLPSDVVMYYVASLKRYGEVVEGEKQGEYYSYLLTHK